MRALRFGVLTLLLGVSGAWIILVLGHDVLLLFQPIDATIRTPPTSVPSLRQWRLGAFMALQPQQAPSDLAGRQPADSPAQRVAIGQGL
jgi:hypothetical protein